MSTIALDENFRTQRHSRKIFLGVNDSERNHITCGYIVGLFFHYSV
ncbi:hypothetical protein ACFPFV_00635 [Salinicoccus siamensis]